MPELPEVETVRRGLSAAFEGARFATVEMRRPDLRFPLPERFAERLTGARVIGLERRAKYLLAPLDTGETLAMHLGMSGSFRVGRPGEADGTPGEFHYARSKDGAHDHVVFALDGPAGLHTVTYNDPRRFGFMELAASSALQAHPLFAALGLEPLGNAFDGAALAALLAGRTSPLKAALLDQRLIAGLGNIYVCEALWLSGLSPRRIAGTLARADGGPGERAHRLAGAIRQVLAEAIEAGGSTLRDHRQADGSLGYFQHSFRVYDREGQPCPRPACGGTVSRIVQSGRSTFFCPRCQR